MKFGSSIIPCLRYRNAAVAIDWLCETFGLERKLVVADDWGEIPHAQLTLGGGMVMVASAGDSEYDRLMNLPEEVGGAGTQSIYVVVDDADEIYKRARAAGAKIAIEIQDEDYGGRGFSCYDLEGHLWNFGTFDPWE